MLSAAFCQAIVSHISDPNLLAFEEVMSSTIKVSSLAHVRLPPVDGERSLSVVMSARHISTQLFEDLSMERGQSSSCTVVLLQRHRFGPLRAPHPE